AIEATSVTFVSAAGQRMYRDEDWEPRKEQVPIRNVRGGISKKSMVLNDATPEISVHPETYEVRADGALLTCDPATELPMAQRYFLF
ncbi:MAG: urease subunit alpha, partial [Pseudomonadota bacterium]